MVIDHNQQRQRGNKRENPLRRSLNEHANGRRYDAQHHSYSPSTASNLMSQSWRQTVTPKPVILPSIRSTGVASSSLSTEEERAEQEKLKILALQKEIEERLASVPLEQSWLNQNDEMDYSRDPFEDDPLSLSTALTFPTNSGNESFSKVVTTSQNNNSSKSPPPPLAISSSTSEAHRGPKIAFHEKPTIIKSNPPESKAKFQESSITFSSSPTSKPHGKIQNPSPNPPIGDTMPQHSKESQNTTKFSTDFDETILRQITVRLVVDAEPKIVSIRLPKRK